MFHISDSISPLFPSKEHSPPPSLVFLLTSSRQLHRNRLCLTLSQFGSWYEMISGGSRPMGKDSVWQDVYFPMRNLGGSKKTLYGERKEWGEAGMSKTGMQLGRNFLCLIRSSILQTLPTVLNCLKNCALDGPEVPKKKKKNISERAVCDCHWLWCKGTEWLIRTCKPARKQFFSLVIKYESKEESLNHNYASKTYRLKCLSKVTEYYPSLESTTLE